jgi:hypothetical protein
MRDLGLQGARCEKKVRTTIRDDGQERAGDLPPPAENRPGHAPDSMTAPTEWASMPITIMRRAARWSASPGGLMSAG